MSATLLEVPRKITPPVVGQESPPREDRGSDRQ